MKWLLLLCALLPVPVLRAQPSIVLRDSQQVTLRGELMLEPAGRLQFVTVKMTQSYTPSFQDEGGKQMAGEALHEISLSNYADYALLYKHRGQQVTVAGKLMLDHENPYFRQGLRLQATGIVTDKGVDLRGRSRGTWIEASTDQYRGEVVLPADLAAPWIYRREGGSDAAGYLSCSSNGGGDVVNCFCAHGFHPIELKSSQDGSVWQARILRETQVAQFEVGADPRRVDLSVTCSR